MLKNIITGEVIEKDPTQELADQGYVPITSESLKPIKPIEISQPPTDTNNYQGLISGGLEMANNLLASNNQAPIASEGTSLDAQLKSLLGGEPPSAANLYEGTYGVGPTQAEITTKNEAVIANQKEFDLLNAQMKALNAEAQAVPIAVQQESAGRGITAYGAQPIQTARLRDIALRSLPLEGQILAAQANLTGSQSALALAQSKFDKVFELRLQDATNQYNYKKDQQDKIWNYLTQKEQDRLTDQRQKDQNEFTLLRDNIANAQTIAKTATENRQADIAAQITALNPKSPTFLADLGKLQAQIKPKAEKADTQIVEVGGRKILIDSQTGQTLKDLGVAEVVKPTTIKWQIKTVNGEDVLFNEDTGETKPVSQNIATGDIVLNNIGGREIKLDAIASPSLNLINQQALDLGGLRIGATATSTLRTTQQQQKLYDTYLKGGPQAAKPGTSAHEKGLAIDLYPDQAYIEKMKPIMEANGWVQNAGEADKGHFEYVGKEEIGLSKTDVNALVMSLGKMVYGTRISDIEGKRVAESITSYVKQNPSATVGDIRIDLMNKFLGFDIKKNYDLGSNLLNTVLSASQEKGMADFDMAGLAKLINDDKKIEAITKVENFAMSQSRQLDPDNYLGEGAAKTTVNLAKDLKNYVNGLGSSPVGVVKGSIQDWLGRFKKGEAASIKAKVVALISDWRKQYAGVNVTQTELEFVNSIAPQLYDSPDNFMRKLNALTGQVMIRYNSSRDIVGLPVLSEQAVIHRNEKANFYNSDLSNQSNQSDNLTDEEAYQEYLKIINQ